MVTIKIHPIDPFDRKPYIQICGDLAGRLAATLKKSLKGRLAIGPVVISRPVFLLENV